MNSEERYKILTPRNDVRAILRMCEQDQRLSRMQIADLARRAVRALDEIREEAGQEPPF